MEFDPTMASKSHRIITSTESTMHIPTSVSRQVNECSSRSSSPSSSPSSLRPITRNVKPAAKVYHESPFISAVTESTFSSESNSHVLTIQISEEKVVIQPSSGSVFEAPLLQTVNHQQTQAECNNNNRDNGTTVVSVRDSYLKLSSPFLVQSQQQQYQQYDGRQLLESEQQEPKEMVQKSDSDLDVNKQTSTYLYYVMSASGQCSPSDTTDSGTCSDMENTPPLLPKKHHHHENGKKMKYQSIHEQKNTFDRRESFIDDSGESESSLSCDSLNLSDLMNSTTINKTTTIISTAIIKTPSTSPYQSLNIISLKDVLPKQNGLPDSLLRDIRDRSTKLLTTTLTKKPTNGFPNKVKNKCSSTLLFSENDNGISVLTNQYNKTDENIDQDCFVDEKSDNCVLELDQYKGPNSYDDDKFYNFHIKERVLDCVVETESNQFICKDDESFVGFRDIHSGTSTIRSSKGTVRGVKNRVRNGIATFLQLQQSNVKNYKEKDAGKVVLYTTSMGIVRETYAKCANVKQILRTLLVKFEERDVFMSIEYQQEIKDRMQSQLLQIPQLFVDGQHIGDSEQVERLNESGELRQMLKVYKSLTPTFTCQMCGGYRLLPCPSCKGSKKSVHRNHFTTEFVALKCMNCDEVGLVKCFNC